MSHKRGDGHRQHRGGGPVAPRHGRGVPRRARQEEPVTVAAGCAGGRRRAATVAGELAERCAARGLDVDLVDRDLDKDVVER